MPSTVTCAPLHHAVTGAQQQFGTITDVVPAEELGMGMWPGDPSWQIVRVAREATRMPP